MSCILRVNGSELNLDDCLAGIDLTPEAKYIKGESRVSLVKSGQLNESSGFTLLASDNDEVSVQIGEALMFLRKNHPSLKTLSDRPDVESSTLDFAWYFPVGENGAAAQFRKFPPELLRLCGDLNIGIEVSVYATEEDNDEE